MTTNHTCLYCKRTIDPPTPCGYHHKHFHPEPCAREVRQGIANKNRWVDGQDLSLSDVLKGITQMLDNDEQGERDYWSFIFKDGYQQTNHTMTMAYVEKRKVRLDRLGPLLLRHDENEDKGIDRYKRLVSMEGYILQIAKKLRSLVDREGGSSPFSSADSEMLVRIVDRGDDLNMKSVDAIKRLSDMTF